MPTEMDAALLAQLKEAYGDTLPPWLEAELSGPLQPIPLATADACRAAASGDPILRHFAERLAERMPPAPTCAHRVLAHELLLASAIPHANPLPGQLSDSSQSRERESCALRDLGCGGPCALRCHTHAGDDTLSLLRQAVRCIAVTYEFSEPGEVPAAHVKWVKRRELPPLPLERQ